MRVADEIGIEKIIKFAVMTLVYCLYPICILPPIRKFFLTIFGASIGSGSIIMNVKFFNLHHKGLSGFKIGKDCFIGDETLIDLYDTVTLEDQVTVAQRVNILTHTNVGYKDHPLQKYFPKESKPVTIKSGSVIGATSTILPGITIGKESFSAAGSMVTEDVPERTLVGGVPAKTIRKIK